MNLYLTYNLLLFSFILISFKKIFFYIFIFVCLIFLLFHYFVPVFFKKPYSQRVLISVRCHIKEKTRDIDFRLGERASRNPRSRLSVVYREHGSSSSLFLSPFRSPSPHHADD